MRFLDTHGKEAEIVWNPLAFGSPLAVWVFVFHHGKLLLGRHREGHFEWVLGTIAEGERPEDAARRAAYEKVGARVSELSPIGQFRGIRPDGGPRRSTIYTAIATRLDPPPVESGMARVEHVPPDDLTILRDGGRYMHDASFAIVMTYLVAQDLVPRD